MFLLSGAAALVYQAVWQREFTLLFGSSGPATAAVLAAYFAGLGLGSFVLGKFAARLGSPLAIYAFLEAVIANGALFTRPILSLYANFYPGLFERFESGGAAFVLVKGLLAFAALALPTMAMGGTLPVLAQIFEDRRARFGDLAGWLYMLNTIGAAAGVLAFPFLLEAMGMKETVRVCVILNFLLAIAAFLLARKERRGEIVNAKPATGQAGPIQSWVWLALLSGFLTFVLQVGWNRAFAQVHENSIYSFTLIVAIFVAAIAAGAQVSRWLLRRKIRPAVALGRAWLGGGILTLLAPFMFVNLTGGLRYAESAGAFDSQLILPALLVVFFPVVLLAAALPLILQETANRSRGGLGRLTGSILATNTAGAGGGGPPAGFVLPAILGLWGTISGAGIVAMVVGGVLAGRTATQRAGFAGAAILVGAIVLARELPRTRVESARGEKLVAIDEGTHGVVAVMERSGSRRLKLNNHYVLGGTAATGDERMQAHLPLLLHPEPRRVVFLGYGTGITAGGATFHPGTESIAVELVPEAASMARQFFAEANRNFHASPSARLVLEDARNFLRGTRERFDLIVGDLVVPWRSGEGALYTFEQFKFGRERLATGGVYCAWLPMFQLAREDFETILRTFQWVFPNVSVWRGDFSPREPALALVGAMVTVMNPEVVQRRLARMQPDPSNPQLQFPPAFWMHLVGTPARAMENPVLPESLNSENRPLIELRRRRGKYFVGRELQAWENELRARSASQLQAILDAEALQGWEAGRLMSEFTHLMSEGRQAEAMAVQQQIRARLGAAPSAAIFGQ